MTAVPWPDTLRPAQSRVWLQTASVIVSSDVTPALRTTFELPASWYRCDYIFGPINNVLKRQLQGFAAGLRGPNTVLTVRDWDYDYDTAVNLLGGGASGTITATGSKDAATVALAGVGGTGRLNQGDRIGIAGSVYTVTINATASGGNMPTLPIAPRLRADCTGAAVTLTNLMWQMQLLDGNQFKLDIESWGHVPAGLTVNFIEALP